MPFHIKKTTSILILLAISASALRAQNNELGKDYGFQINELGVPKLAPSGYESVLSVELDKPLSPDKAYEMGFWIIGRQLEDRAYSYPITVFPSNSMDRVSRDILDLVESREIMPRLEVNPPPSYTSRGHFIFVVRPDIPYNYLTVALKKGRRERSPINFDEDVNVIGLFVRPLAAKQKDSASTQPTAKASPKRIAERELIDSNKSYTVFEKEVSIGLYDHRNIDKDVVTIYLNENIVVQNLELKRKKQLFDIRLRPGINTITLHAENLGQVSPNTAAILIRSDSKEYVAVLESDLGQSEYFTLVYEPN